MSTTVNRQYPYPRRKGDGADVAYWMQQLAEALDTDVQVIFGKFDNESPRFYSPLGASGWTVTGSIGVENITTPTGPTRRTTVDLDIIRTGGAYSVPAGATAFGSIGTLIPTQARLASGGAYLTVAISGNAMNQTGQVYVDYDSGAVMFRAAGATGFTMQTAGQFSVNLTYAGTPAPA